MPLLDHFHPPLAPRHPWVSFHSLWCGAMLECLNDVLPPRYLGTVHVHLGPQVAADLAEFDQEPDAPPGLGNGRAGAAVAAYAPPAATATIDAVFPDDIEVRVSDTRDGARLVAVVELVSPRNKDRDDARDAFVDKCAAYLQRGIGLAVVDVVTGRGANLHDALAARLRHPGIAFPEPPAAYAVSYRPATRGERPLIDVWREPLALGEELPTMPLALPGWGVVPLELERSYTRARHVSRV
ncbi:MAG: DUF4058 family protein [Gemmataceae bacterium]|nr:DUF4058 family protein [Gemmataceae bacterium]